MKKVEAAEAEVNKTYFLTLHATQQEISNMIQTPWISWIQEYKRASSIEE